MKKVWSAENGSNPVTLVGHSSGISDLAIVEKGRNVVSVSRDGSCKLWDVGESKCLANVSKFDSFINCCSIQSTNLINDQDSVSDENRSKLQLFLHVFILNE
jgi:proteasomal ATPase-associated factor 1